MTGLSRHPESIGKHPLYTTKVLDVANCPFTELHESLKGYDVVFNEFSPHAEGHAALTYMPFVEATRKIVLAVKVAKVPYFIMVGGSGSLYLPSWGWDHVCAGESGHFWRAFRQMIADSEAHVQYMEERLGPLGVGLRQLRNAREKVRRGEATPEDIQFMKSYYDNTFKGDYSQTFVKAARVTWMFFEGNQSFPWSYASPPPGYRPSPKENPICISYDMIPLEEEPILDKYLGWDKDDPLDLEGRLLGISTADFARALVDDAETRKNIHKHWTAYTPLKDDTPWPSYARLE